MLRRPGNYILEIQTCKDFSDNLALLFRTLIFHFLSLYTSNKTFVRLSTQAEFEGDAINCLAHQEKHTFSDSSRK